MQSVFDSRKNNLDAIRLLLAVFVIFSHSFPLSRGSDATEPFFAATGKQTTGGTIAVDLFFVISGFLIANSYLNSRSLLSYLKKRIYRIYPGFTIAMALCALAVAPLALAVSPFASLGERLLDFLLRTLQLQEFRYHNAFATNPYPWSINGSAWSISYEFWCYLGVALLGVGGLLRRRATVLTLFALSLIISFLFALNHWRFGPSFFGIAHLWARMAPMYLAGVVFYLYRNHVPHSNVWAAAALGVLLASAFVPMSWDLCFPFAGAYLVFWFGFHPGISPGDFTRFGDLSYGTYLYAFPIQQLVAHYFRSSLSPYLLFAIATPLTLLAAALSWWGVERWFVASKRPPIGVPPDRVSWSGPLFSGSRLGREVRGGLAVAGLGVVLLASASGVVNENRGLNTIPVIGSDSISVSERRFDQIRKALADHGAVGYVSDLEPGGLPEITARWLAQYSLAPLQLIPSTPRLGESAGGMPPEIAVGDFGSVPAAQEVIRRSGYSISRDFGSGVMLLNRVATK